jgi:hypothetical protein
MKLTFLLQMFLVLQIPCYYCDELIKFRFCLLNLLDVAVPVFVFVIADLQYFIHNVWLLHFVQEVSLVPRVWSLGYEGLCSHYATKLPLSSL